jgi:hypothetical protein
LTRFTRRTVAQVFAGVLLLQVVWALAVPPYRGMDEFDHVYRAESVATGHLIPQHQPPGYQGRGDLVRARLDTIEAAYPICHSYRNYIADSDCRQVRTFADGTADVASGAARYDPVFYAVVGMPTRWLGPAASLYAMRLLTAAICAALVALAAWACSLWARTAWPLLAVLLTCTPMAMYSGATPAPNGPEMFAGLALWTALVGLRSVDPADPRTRSLLFAALPPALLLCFLRTLGPLWLAMICLSVVALVGPRRVVQVARARKGLLTVALTSVGCALVGSVAWSVAMGTNSLSSVADAHNPHPLLTSVELVPLWVLQAIGAFPDKGDAAPGLVYLAALLLMGSLLARALRRAELRTRVVLLGVMSASVLVPFVVSVRTYSHLGAAWQGRYTWPYACGVLVLIGLVLDLRRTPVSKLAVASVTLGVMAAIHIPGPLAVLHHEILTSPLSGTAQWRLPPAWLLVAITMAALLMFVDALLRAQPAHLQGRRADHGRADTLPARVGTGAALS